MIYTVTFNPAIDYVVWTDRLEPGHINRARREAIQLGGKGINVSTMLMRLGVESVALGFVAGFTGQALETGLQRAGLRTEFIHLDRGTTRINVKVKGKEETEINGIGPDIGPEAVQALTDRLDRLKRGDILVLAGSMPASLPEDTYGRVLAGLTGKGVRTVVDARGELLRGALRHRPFLIKPNRAELESLFGRTLETEEEICACAAQLCRQGAEHVLVSLAGEGAILLDGRGEVHRLAAPGGQVRNSVGAGDAMVAGFLAGWLGTGSYEQALRLGVAAGSATAFSDAIASREDVERVLAELEKRPAERKIKK